jgi:hypothetical protein
MRLRASSDREVWRTVTAMAATVLTLHTLGFPAVGAHHSDEA